MVKIREKWKSRKRFETNPGVCLTRASSKNAKSGYVRKSVFEKKDILGQNLGKNRGKKSLSKNKLFSSTLLKLKIIFLKQ